MFVSPLLHRIRKSLEKLDEKNFFLPNEFFNVRQEITPKATSKVTMYFCAGFAYLTTLGIFVALVITQSLIVTKETNILTTDITGQERGWTCRMLSEVSEQYIYGTSEPTLDFSLVEVSESGSSCTRDLTAASPCDRDLLVRMAPVDVALPASADSHMVSWKGEIVYFNGVKYTIAEGTMESGGEAEVSAVDADGEGYALEGAAIMNYHADHISTLVFTGAGVLLNDNLYNMYMLATDENILYTVDITSGQLTVLLNSTISGTFARAAVYQRNGVVELYYLTSTALSASFDLKSNINGVTTTLLSDIARASNSDTNLGLYIDPEGTYAYVNTFPSNFARYDLVANPGTLELISGPLDAYGWVLLDSATIFYASAGSDMFDIATAVSTPVLHITGGTEVGWFTCGDQTLTHLPSSAAAASSSCSSNGLLWKATFQTPFYGIAAAFDAKILAAAGDACTGSALYERVCNAVSHLPPYICEREIHQPIFTVLSTALANAQFYLVVVLFVSAYVMDQLASRQESRKIKISPVEHDVEMANASTVEAEEGSWEGGSDALAGTQ